MEGLVDILEAPKPKSQSTEKRLHKQSKITQILNTWVLLGKQCKKELGIENSPLQNPSKLITGPGDSMEIDVLPDLPPSGSYGDKVTVMFVIPNYLIAGPTASQDGWIFARAKFDIMTKQA